MAAGDRQYKKFKGFKWTVGNEDVPALALVVDQTSRQLHITEPSDVMTDWNVGNDSHPSVYIHSATTPETNYMKFYHDASNGIIDVAATTVLTMSSSAWSSVLPLTLTYSGNALNITATVSAAVNIVEVIGTSTATSGTVRSIWAKLSAGGSGLTQARVFSSTLTITDTTDYGYGYYAYTSAVSNKTMQQMAGIYIYMEDMGNAVQHQVGLSINRNIATVGVATDCLLEMRNHGSTAATAFVKIVGSATYLWDFDQGDQVVPIDAWTSGTTVSHRAAIRMADGNTRYLHIFTS